MTWDLDLGPTLVKYTLINGASFWPGQPYPQTGAVAVIFCAVVNCTDGRAQLSVIHDLQNRFDTKYVDSITEAGDNPIVVEQDDPHLK